MTGVCKHVGALLWKIVESVRRGINKSCTSKPQQWHKPSKKSDKIHPPEELGKILSVKAGDDLYEMEDQRPHYTPRDPRAIGHRQRTIFTDEDFDNLAEASKRKCAILLYRRKRNLSVQIPDIGHVVHFENVTANNYLCL